ncbi:MAG: T9SS type A sorting domain-containing protein [Dysgonamonadaceae bacterium]|jgi:hypothetical protein|nr:T9SS type A sorting domain-containing protein [Dysgonamonadaceae bacterium]
MRTIHLFIAFILFAGNLFAAATWDILDKSMAAWNADGGASTNRAWAINQGGAAGGVALQREGYVNFTKTNAGGTGSGCWSWVKPATALTNLTGTDYSIEVKARVNAIGIADGTYFETNQISLRLKSKNIVAPIFLKHGNAESGSLSIKPGDNAYIINTSEWQVYRLVFHANTSKYDVYVEGVDDPVFENIATDPKQDDDGVYFGAESQHRCNIDIEYVKMGTGDFFAKSRISSVTLSRENHQSGSASTVSVSVNTVLIANGEKLLVSFVDRDGNNVVDPVEVTVTNNVATAAIVIPAIVPEGQYSIKVAAPGNQIGGVAVSPKTIPYEIIDPTEAQTWDILNRNFFVKAWNAAPAWVLENNNVPAGFVTQQSGYVNIKKMQAGGSYLYGFLTSPPVNVSANTAYTYEVKARTHAIDKTEFPDALKPPSSGSGGYESNHIAFRLNNKYMSIHLINGDANTGYIASHIADGTGPSYTARHALNTSEWHVYRLIFNADNKTYNIYVDGELIFEDVLLLSKSGTNYAKIGGESWQRCNMDIEYVRLGTGDLVSGNSPKITSVELSSDSHIANHERTIRVTANTSFVDNGTKLLVSLTDENGTDKITPIEITVNANKATADLTIPATVSSIGKYKVTVASSTGTIGDQALSPKIMQYVVVDVSPIETNMLPQVKTVGYIRKLADYQYYTGSKEFIFPSIIDTKKYTVDGKFKNGQTPINRYYLYYAPHENPGGIFLSTAPTLDGPWTEYDGSLGMWPGTVIDFEWAAARSEIVRNGAERHISACQVVWNEVQDKYIMYFHGPNTTTHYAVSDDLVNWTFGASILIAHQFSPIGEEASYAKAFEHEIPGLGNKYVLLLMNQESQIRRIYWAHSTDGINWTPVTKPLISPDLNYKKVPGTDRKPNFDGGQGGAYGNNASGPFLMKRGGRYFVICHDSADNLHVVEVGESFDMEVHWGEYMTKADVILDGIATRPAAVDFIQDDNGRWYMFFEAGGRLDANIAYSREEEASNSLVVPACKGISTYPSSVKKGEKLTVNVENTNKFSVDIIDVSGNRIFSKRINESFANIHAPFVSGVYFVKVTTNENLVETSKIVVR